MFAALGRFTVRFRWLVVAAWIVAIVGLVAGLPTLSSVEKSSNSDFLPASSASVRAGTLAAAFKPTHGSQATLVAASPTGPLTAADNAAIDRAEHAGARRPRVTAVTDQGVSANGRARKATVDLVLPSRNTSAAATRHGRPDPVDLHHPETPRGLVMHLTGSVAQGVDQQNQTSKIQTLTELLSVLFIILLLFLTFRAVLAPVIALLPSAVALVAAGPLIAASTHLGVQVSDLTPILLVVVMLGAGTDYGLFLIFRVREEIRRGTTPPTMPSRSRCARSVSRSPSRA